jgi:hypothetical protein
VNKKQKINGFERFCGYTISLTTERPMRTTNDRIARALLPVLTGAGCMVTMLIAMNAITELSHSRPRIGDIVAFTATQEEPVEGDTRMGARRPDQFGCALDLNTLRHSGGSLFVEGELPRAPGSFRVHWGGERTSTDTGNCGANADLILEAHELDILASVAGGYGVGPNRTLVLVNEIVP